VLYTRAKNITFATAQGCSTSKLLNTEGTPNSSSSLAESKISARVNHEYTV